MTRTERLQEYSVSCGLKAGEMDQLADELRAALATLDERYTLAPELRPAEADGMVTVNAEGKAMEERSLKAELRTATEAAEVYRRRAEYAAKSILYIGRYELNYTNAKIEMMDAELRLDCARSPSLVMFTDLKDDITFNRDGSVLRATA